LNGKKISTVPLSRHHWWNEIFLYPYYLQSATSYSL
jgi:hypothetical protein